MKKATRLQLDYLRGKMTSFRSEKTREINEKYPHDFTDKEVYEMVKKGKVKLISYEDFSRVGHYCRLTDFYDFSKMEPKTRKKNIELTKLLNKKVEETIDKIILSDVSEAQDLLNDLKKEFSFI